MRTILPVVAAILLTGCGLKDDLYLPEPEADASAVEEMAPDTAPFEAGYDDDDATRP